SSRRRHTRSTRDWSSDVCSSDLRSRGHADEVRGAVMRRVLVGLLPMSLLLGCVSKTTKETEVGVLVCKLSIGCASKSVQTQIYRSEERRVGEEGRVGGGR